jgi:UDP-glucuronate 4-epimerase
MQRDFTYIDDIVEGVIRTSDHIAPPNPQWDSMRPDPGSSRAPWRVYNIGNNNPVELMHLIGTLEQALGRTAEKRMLPMQAGDVPATFADVQALVDDVGFAPATPIETGVANFVAWYPRLLRRVRRHRSGGGLRLGASAPPLPSAGEDHKAHREHRRKAEPLQRV